MGNKYIPPIINALFTPVKTTKNVLKQVMPVALWELLKEQQKKIRSQQTLTLDDQKKDLNYWDNYANLLDDWGKTNVWNEIQLLVSSKKGKILDIACGTGNTIMILKKYPGLELYGFDNSPGLIEKCKSKGISPNQVTIQDATQPWNYANNFFINSYSIGLLHYITESELNFFINENHRVTQEASYHFFLTSTSNENEGVVTTWQQYINQSDLWWINKFKQKFQTVYTIESAWHDPNHTLSKGIWLICIK